LAENYFADEEVVSIETRAGTIKGKVAGDRDKIEVTLFGRGDVKPEMVEKLIRSDDEVVRCYCIDTGVPHAVIEVKDIHNYPITKIGRMVMHHPAFQPNQTNVTFFQQRVGPQIIATTYERGVEKETLACGTGAAAAALVFSELYVQPLPITVSMPGGTLVVDVSSVAKRLLLRGDAQYICTVNIDDIPSEFEPRRPYEGTAS
jgi:diaminopimelate epimerase